MNQPKMSFVIVTMDTYHTIQKTVRTLAAQTINDQLELIIVTAYPAALQPDQADLAGFQNVCVVDTPPTSTIAQARATGIRAASAPIVALTEDHAFPAPDWAELMLKRHQDGYAVVGPAMYNANPKTRISWAILIFEYTLWAYQTQPQTVPHLPGHNSAYRRDLLLAYGDDLGNRLRNESLLHWEFGALGHKLFHETAARTFHLNFSKLSTMLVSPWLGGRLFAGQRAERWSTRKRLVYSAGAPLIPLIRLYRMTHQLTPVLKRRLWWSLPAMIPILFINAVGEMIGYLFGVGESEKLLSVYELHRERRILPGEADIDMKQLLEQAENR